MDIRSAFKRWLVLAALLAACGPAASAVEVGGVRFDDSVRVANQELKLNGAGIRTRVIFKVYAAALYLTDRKATPGEVLALTGPRRIRLVMLRDVSSDDFAKAFMDGLDANSDSSEKAKFTNQTARMRDIFRSIPQLGKGDAITIDWLPDSGLQISLNDKPLGAPLPDIAFANAFLRIWLGKNPVDNLLKERLLGKS